MPSRLPIAVAAVVLCVVVAIAVAPWLGGGAATTTRPNVLLVSVDSLRADHVHAYGYPRETTPTIDRLAREGVLFANAAAPAAWTLPAHVTLFTAMAQREHGVSRARLRLSEEAVTLAEVLRAAGYATAGFVSGPTVFATYGLAQGFELYDESSAERHRGRSQKGITSPKVTGLADDWLEQWDRRDPRPSFFVFLHLWDVHYDYEPPPPYDSMFDPHYEGDLTSNLFEKNGRIHADMPPRDLEHVIALYDGEIRFTDEHVGKVIARLEDLGVLEDTIVVVVSDHGDEFFEHGFKGHAMSLYDETTRVVWVLRYPPGVPGGRVIDGQVRLSDVAPTILGLAGIEPPPGFGSRTDVAEHRAHDLSPWLTGDSAVDTFPALVAVSEQAWAKRDQVALRTERVKLLFSTPMAPGWPQLFDLAADPGETRNLLARGAGARTTEGTTADEQRERLEASFARFEASLEGREVPAEKISLDRDLTERLRALGYLK